MVFAVGHRDLQAFRDEVQVIGAVMRHVLEPGLLHQQQRLQQGRALAPGAGGRHLMPLPLPRDRRLDPRAEIRQVLGGEIATFLLHEGDDLLRDVAPVERRMRGLQPGLAAAFGAGGAILIGHVADGGRQVGLDEQRADRVRLGRPAGRSALLDGQEA
jgi:hypothetical protein